METQKATKTQLLVETPDQVLDLGYGHQVFFQGRLLAATFNSKGAAEAYLDGLRKGRKTS